MADDKSTARCPATHRNTNVLEVAPKHCRWLLCHYSIFPHFFLIFFRGAYYFFPLHRPLPLKKKEKNFPFFFSTDTWNTPPPPSFSRFFVSCFSSSTSFFLLLRFFCLQPIGFFGCNGEKKISDCRCPFLASPSLWSSDWACRFR